MSDAEVTIWDGNEFRVVAKSVASELIAKDMAQDAAKEDGLSLKYRHQFTGYKTRELRAKEPPSPVILQDQEAAAQDTEEGPVTDGAGAGADLSWESYKDKFKEATGKKRATQAAVEAWMADEGIS